MTINDGGFGGDRIFANVFFNCNRESADTGNIYTYNRMPLLSTTRTGSPSLIMATRHIYNNLFFGNCASMFPLSLVQSCTTRYSDATSRLDWPDGSGSGVDNDDVGYAPEHYTIASVVMAAAQGSSSVGTGELFLQRDSKRPLQPRRQALHIHNRRARQKHNKKLDCHTRRVRQRSGLLRTI